MARISIEALEEIRRALKDYHNVCEANLGTPVSKSTYYRYAEQFVRWLNNEFTPGKMR
jgi:hypothetical protein